MKKSKLIELVRERDILWNPENKEYHNKHERQLVWIDIQAKFGACGDFDAHQTWTKLRQSHSKAISRMKHLPSGKGASSRPPWKHWEEMSFLLPFKAPKNTISNLSDDDNGDANTDDNHGDKDTSQISKDLRNGEVTEDSQMFSFSKTKDLRESSSDSSPIRKWKYDKKDSDHISTSSNINKDARSIAKRFSAPRPVESHRMGFFQSILPEVEKLSPSDFVTFQIKVLSSLREVMSPQPSWPRGHITTSESVNDYQYYLAHVSQYSEQHPTSYLQSSPLNLATQFSS